jgi:hypothetical protein
MKHIALLLAILIFALSSVSCGDLTYYKDSGWYCPQEEFHDRYYEPVVEKMTQIATKHGIEFYNGGTKSVADDHFMLWISNEEFTCKFYFTCEERWGKFEAKMNFYGTNASQLGDYNAQKKYVDFLNEFTYTVAYVVDASTNIYEEAYNHCVANSTKNFEKEWHYDDMTDGSKYGLELESENGIKEETEWGCNYYYFEGFIGSNLDVSLASK